MAVNEGPGASYSGRLKPFMSYRTRYATLSTLKERTASNSSIATLAGSTQNLVDPVKLMSMQEDAHCRKISAEVMKRCLYRADPPGRRRAHSRMYNSTRVSTAEGSSSMPPYARMFQSLPATPAHSLTVTPSHSPTNVHGNFFSFLSRGATPRAMTPEEEPEEADEPEIEAGLASVLSPPQPRYIRAFPGRLDESIEESAETSQDSVFTLGFPPIPRSTASHFRNLNVRLYQNPQNPM